jgi:hypothetical protein
MEEAAARAKSAVRPASARQFRPPSARSGRGEQAGSNFSSTYVTFFGQAVYAGDSATGATTGGRWQGKKYSMNSDSVASARSRDPGDMYSPRDQHNSSRHVNFSEKRDRRNSMLQAVKHRTALQAREREMNEGAGAGPMAFIPRIRPRSARPAGDGGSLSDSDGRFGGAPAGEKQHLSSFLPQSPVRIAARLGSPAASGGGHLLTLLNLPSVSEDYVVFNLPVEPISSSVSVDGEVALVRLSEAGPGAKFCDSGFEAGPLVLRARDQEGKSPSRLVDAVEAWKRPEELGLEARAVLYDEASSTASDVLQGALGDCYLLGAMSVIATRKDLLDNIWSHFKRIDPTVTNESLLDKGILTVQLYKDCLWHDVTVDTRLPCSRGADGLLRPCFGRCVAKEHMWVPLLEKAMAKLYGGYGKLEGGSITEAMADLTGGVTHTYNLMDREVDELIAEGGLWRDLQSLKKEGNLMACSRNAPRQDSDLQGPLGLLVNHAYAILDVRTLPDSGHRLLLVRDPWGSGTFTGKWRKQSEMWKLYPTAAKCLGHVPEDRSGSFWMTFEELVENMTTVHVCRIFPPQYHSLSVKSEWDGESAGGPPGQAEWFKNPQFRLSVTQNATVVLSVVQYDAKIPGRTHKPVLGGLVVLKARRGTSPVRMWGAEPDQIVGYVPPSPGREVSLSVRLSQGVLYYLVPFTSSSGITAPFMLRCYSSHMVELQRVAQPCCVHVRSQWLGIYAGGRRPEATWSQNPQFFLFAAQDQDVMLLLDKEGGGKSINNTNNPDEGTDGDPGLDPHVLGSEIGFTLFKTKKGERVRDGDDSEVHADSGFMSPNSAALLYR